MVSTQSVPTRHGRGAAGLCNLAVTVHKISNLTHTLLAISPPGALYGQKMKWRRGKCHEKKGVAYKWKEKKKNETKKKEIEQTMGNIKTERKGANEPKLILRGATSDREGAAWETPASSPHLRASLTPRSSPACTSRSPTSYWNSYPCSWENTGKYQQAFYTK